MKIRVNDRMKEKTHSLNNSLSKRFIPKLKGEILFYKSNFIVIFWNESGE